MMWEELSLPWRTAFEQAWEAYCSGSVPIGAALVDESGKVIATGRSMQFERSGEPGQIVWSKLSHAELNVLLQISAHDHPNIRGCTLYTTMEPCPLCFGALVMSNVRNLCYAARDAWAGSTNLLHANEYISSKPIRVTGPDEQLEIVSIAINTEHFLRHNEQHNQVVIQAWNKDCPSGVQLGREWFKQGKLDLLRQQDRSISSVFDEACSDLRKNTYFESDTIDERDRAFRG